MATRREATARSPARTALHVGGPEIVEVAVDPGRPAPFVGAVEPDGGPFGEVEEPLPMALLDRSQRPGRPEALLAELPQRLEQPVAGFVGVEQLHHRLVDEVDDGADRDAVGGVDRTAHRLGGVQIERPGED